MIAPTKWFEGAVWADVGIGPYGGGLRAISDRPYIEYRGCGMAGDQ